MRHIKRLTIIFFSLLLLFNSISFATIKVESGAAILAETSSGRILYEKNINTKMYPASTTKIMTAILVLENCKLTDTAQVSLNAVQSIPTGYVNANLQPGEELLIKDLLYALMVKSANDAAVVLAEHVAGSVENFSNMMNKKSKELGCSSTNFVNPNGIHNSNHYSTAYDLYLIARYCMKNDDFRNLVSTTSYTLPATNKYPNNDRTFSTTNELIKINNNNRPDNYYYRYAIGIKTGYTTEAKNCIVAGALRDNLEFISVILGGGTNAQGLSERYIDSINLFNYAFDNFTLTKVKEPNMIVKTIEIENATKETKKLDLLIKDSITVINNKSTDVENIIPEITLNADLKAPILKGDTVGRIKYIVDDIEYASDLLASEDVLEKNNTSFYIFISGTSLLLFAMFLMPQRKKRRNSKKRNF